MNNNQILQLNKERMTTRRKEKIGSPLRSTLFTIKSAMKVKTKNVIPRDNAKVNPPDGETAKAEKPAIKQSTATDMIAFLNEGRKNMEE
jgi:hypothetical protein